MTVLHLMFPIGLFIALPVNALVCCKCYPAGDIDKASCLTDTSIQCADFSTKINNPNIKDLTCETVNEAKCKPITPDNGVCPSAPVDATKFTPATGSVVKAYTTFEPIVPEISPLTNIPGLHFSQKLEVQGNRIVIPFLAEYVMAVYKYLAGISIVAAAVMIVYGGFHYVLGGTISSIEKGKERIRDAVIGILLVFGSTTILYTVGGSALTDMSAISLRNIDPVYAKNEEVNPDVPAGTATGNGTVGNKPFLPQVPFDDEDFTPIPGEADVAQPLPVKEFKQYSAPWGTMAYGTNDHACSRSTSKAVDSDGTPCCTTFTMAGCGATALAEIYSYNDASTDPLQVGQMLTNRNLRICNSGTLMNQTVINGITKNDPQGNPPYGLKLIAISSIENVVKTLRSGQPVMFNCKNCVGKVKSDSISPKPPDGIGEDGKVSFQNGWKFYGGHYMVLTGVDDQGKIFTVSDVGNPDGHGIVNISQGQLRGSNTSGFWAIKK